MAKPKPLITAASLPLLGGLLWLLAVWLTVPTLPSSAQFTPTVTMQFVTADPAGACALNVPLRYNTSNGKLWGCDALTWTLVAAGTFSGSLAGDVTGTQSATVVGKVGGNAIVLANPFTTAGAFPLTLTQTASTSVTLPAAGTLAILGANTFTAPQNFAAGTVSAPALTLNGDSGVGWYQDATSRWTFTAGGTARLSVISSLMRGGSAYIYCWSATDALASCDTGISRSASGIVAIGTGAAGNTAGNLYSAGLNFGSTENGAANAIACAAGCGPALATGLVVTIKLAHTLQAGANTFAYLGGSALAIKSHNNTANNIAAAYASGGLIQLGYDGTQWEDMSQ